MLDPSLVDIIRRDKDLQLIEKRGRIFIHGVSKDSDFVFLAGEGDIFYAVVGKMDSQGRFEGAAYHGKPKEMHKVDSVRVRPNSGRDFLRLTLSDKDCQIEIDTLHKDITRYREKELISRSPASGFYLSRS